MRSTPIWPAGSAGRLRLPAPFVALLSDNGIQIGLCGLFGAAFGDFAKATFGLDLAWWIWAFLALVAGRQPSACCGST